MSLYGENKGVHFSEKGDRVYICYTIANIYEDVYRVTLTFIYGVCILRVGDIFLQGLFLSREDSFRGIYSLSQRNGKGKRPRNSGIKTRANLRSSGSREGSPHRGRFGAEAQAHYPFQFLGLSSDEAQSVAPFFHGDILYPSIYIYIGYGIIRVNVYFYESPCSSL